MITDSLIRTWTYLHPVMSLSALWRLSNSLPDEQSGGSHAVRPPSECVNQDSANVNRPPKCGVWLSKQTVVQEIPFLISSSSFLSSTTTHLPAFSRSLSLNFLAYMVSKRLYIWGAFHLVIPRLCAALGAEQRV